MSAPVICIYCETNQLNHRAVGGALTLHRCTTCGHIYADHKDEEQSERDYHTQYDQTQASAIIKTRARQAHSLTAELQKRIPAEELKLLDFGCGLGTFLKTAKTQGVDVLAGVDTSALAIEGLAQAGVNGLTLTPDDLVEPSRITRALSFRPTVITFLDVIEHFPAHQVLLRLSNIIAVFKPELRWIVIKVPVSNGLLYKFADILARVGVTATLEQLYQVGTFPPHYSYFSTRSLALLAERLGFINASKIYDLDFEPNGFSARVGALSRLPRLMGSALGHGLSLTIGATGTEDSCILIGEIP